MKRLLLDPRCRVCDDLLVLAERARGVGAREYQTILTMLDEHRRAAHPELEQSDADE